ncbi:hypothetical protein OIDMADRAFT_25390 [Oidiodendron maius Zn]|uniref:Major facilitator superfamily (MFS) profile domain-containing protein n=1 Tax=Oidiodendron maius (strain Zn) TaxID=913774 RepID=A0A0C3HR72_OIDMZ|nr:hypothetical protein OIDMADRAFT_25390 [Oidiodendron maius Zn]
MVFFGKGTPMRGGVLYWAITAARGVHRHGHRERIQLIHHPDVPLDYGLSFASGSVQWRLPISFQAFFAICLVLQTISLPEIPRYLIEQNRVREATSVLARLMGPDTPDDDEEVVFQRRQIESSLEIESAGGPFRFAELLEGGKIQNFRRLCLCCPVNVMQQFTGANMINYYAPVVYDNTMGLSRNLSLILGGCTSLTYLAASFIPLWTVERFGRRVLLMVSAGGLCFCFSMASIMLSIGTRHTAEITTTTIRFRGQALGGFINWMCVFTVVQMTPIAINSINCHTFIIFAIFCFLWIPIVYMFFPETNQLRLEDIDHLFEEGGITGVVWRSKGERTVEPGYHARVPNMEGVAKGGLEMGMGVEVEG